MLQSEAAVAVAFVAGGIALGAASGLLPGLHANNMAFLLAGVAPSVPRAMPPATKATATAASD